MTNEQFERDYYPRYKSVIARLARKLAKRDEAMFEDLVQTGMITLWELDPRLARSNEDAWVRQALYNKMVDVLRRDRPSSYDSLTAHFARGDQLVLDQDTNEPMLLEASRRFRRRVLEGEEEDQE